MTAITGKDVTAAILAWLEALAAVPMRSVSSQLARACELGCRVQGGLPPPPPLVHLLAAERPLRRCSESDKQLLRAKYGDAVVVVHCYEIDGAWKERYQRVWKPDVEVARLLGAPSVRAVQRRLERARRRVKEALQEMR